MDAVSVRITAALGVWSRLQGRVLLYLPLSDEPDLGSIEGPELYVTRTPDNGGPLTVHRLGGSLEKHRLGFEQPLTSEPEIDPSTIDMALVPGLAFDRYGHRLGRGSGYFDRLLPKLADGALRVGVAPRVVVVDRLPSEAHDVAMTHLVTERGITPAVSTDIPVSSERVIAAGRALGVDVEVRHFPEGTKTSQDAADAIGCPVAAIVKSLVFTVDGDPVVALLAGDLRLDVGKLAAAHGGRKAARADLETVRAATGYAAGGTPPFGHSMRLPIYADPGLRRNEMVWAAAGTPTTVFPITVESLALATSAVWVDLAES
jgi:5,10-methenyltetrahydrofolate synthetase